MNKTAILVGVNTDKNEEKFEYSLEELENLAVACDIQTVGKVTQNLHRIHQAHYLGKGKIEFLKEVVESTEVDVIIFDDELSPSQIRNIDNIFDCEVIDRTKLILENFVNRAKTKESKLQVEIARLKYMLPRLVGSNESLERQGGGSGLMNRGAGETKLEMDRRKIEEQISKINRELKKIVEQRNTQRKQRMKRELPVVSLVGYTNAGKSTMMNAMLESFNKETDKQVFEKDMLFATLETSVRQVNLASNHTFLLTDTVGFISKLPHHLIKAFRSTLEEAVEADLLIHVLDISNPHHEEQRELTNEILRDIGVEGVPVIYAYNKSDLTERRFPAVEQNRVYLSAKNRKGMDMLTEQIKKHIFSDYVSCTLVIPYNEGQVVAYFNERANVIKEEYVEEGTKLVVECKLQDALKYDKYVVELIKEVE